MTRGTVTLTGIYRPVAGSPISLAYSDGVNWIARVPRRLRVLSSSADPLRNITTISVGCLLLYHSNRKPPVTALEEKDENAAVPETVRRVAALPMTANWVAGRILSTLGLTAAGPLPFTVSRVVDKWDMSSGYVEELGRIADSDGYFAWMNEAEEVEFISKRTETGTGQLVTRENIVDLTPVNVGDLPGEAVFARYTSLKLTAPDSSLTDEQIQQRNWEYEKVIGGPIEAIHSYTDAAGQTIKEYITYNEWSWNRTNYDANDRVTNREERTNTLNGVRLSRTNFRYRAGVATTGGEVSAEEDLADVVSEVSEEWSPKGDVAASCGFDGPHAEFRMMGETYTSWRETSYDKNKASGITKTTTRNATLYINTPFGSDAIAKLREAGEPKEELLKRASRMVPYGSNVRIRTERQFGLQKRPGQQDRNSEALSKVPTTEEVSSIRWVLGSPASQTAIELSPPYTSDDRIAVTGSGPTAHYSVIPSGAQQQANAYATTENRLLLGNRNGQGIQLSPLHMPARPFDPLYIRLNGCTGAYRTNGTTWTLGPDGVRCTTDALFLGAVDGTVADAWFPLPPSIAALPGSAAVTTNAAPQPANAMPIPAGFNFTNPDLGALFAALPIDAPAVPTATISPTRIVKPYHEVIQARGGVRVGGAANLRYWVPTTITAGGGVRVGGVLREISQSIARTSATVVPGLVTMTSSGTATGGPALLLHLDAGFTDSSLNAVTVTNHGATISTASPKFGSGCAVFNGADQRFEANGASLALGGGSWTIGVWVKIPASGDWQTILQFPGPELVGLEVSNNGAIRWVDSGGEYAGTSLPDNVWSYVEVAKEGNTLRLFVDGVKASFDMQVESWHGTNNITATRLIVGSGVYDDGSGEVVTQPLTGSVDDLVLIPNQPLHTANFTPPTAAYPNP
jgi:hypothetical protein